MTMRRAVARRRAPVLVVIIRVIAIAILISARYNILIIVEVITISLIIIIHLASDMIRIFESIVFLPGITG